MILMIDNYDSFTYNVYQYIGSLYPQIQVVRNDEITIDEIRNLQNLEALVISPGPGYPDSAGISKEAIKTFGKEIPVLGSAQDIRQSEKYTAEKSFQQKN